MILNLAVAFLFSFLGSIPPGTVNLTVLQLGIEGRISTAIKFAFAAALIEYPYGYIAVKFATLISQAPTLTDNFKIITGVVMIGLGVLTLWSSAKPSAISTRFQNSGFRKGLVLGILNPLAIPYWIAITTYLKSQQWIAFRSEWHIHTYLLGIFAGAFVILVLFAYAARKVATLFESREKLKKIPGIVLIVLGIYSFLQLI